jgi:hypothetical protein
MNESTTCPHIVLLILLTLVVKYLSMVVKFQVVIWVVMPCSVVGYHLEDVATSILNLYHNPKDIDLDVYYIEILIQEMIFCILNC